MATGHSSGTADPSTSDKNRAARTTSSVVTPNNRLGSNLPAFFNTSAAIGTVYSTRTRISPVHTIPDAASTNRVDRVGDDQNVRVGRIVGDGLSQVTHNPRVGVEQVVTGHTGLAGDTGRNDDDLDAMEGFGELLLGVALDRRGRVDVRDVGGDSDGPADIVQAQRAHELVLLEEERERLADSTCER
jgi:hypothetical protein